jgi:aspartate 1-decarboxylase
VILATFADMTREEARVHRPRVVRVDAKNRLVAAYDADEEPGEILNSLEPAPDRPGLGSA